jgi:hypothetical protein
VPLKVESTKPASPLKTDHPKSGLPLKAEPLKSIRLPNIALPKDMFPLMVESVTYIEDETSVAFSDKT